MRILITGAAGFIGSHVADFLNSHDHDLFLIDDLSTGKAENVLGGQFLKASILDDPIMNRAFKDFQPEVVVHLAAQPAISTSMAHPWLDFDINVCGTMKILSLCRYFGVKRVIFSSTSAVYDSRAEFCQEYGTLLQPDSPYGISKLSAEMYIRNLFPESVILRFGNVFGPRQVPLGENQLIARMIRHFEYGDSFYIHGTGEQRRDFVYVADVAKAVEKAITGPAGTYNIASGKSHSVNQVAKVMEFLYDVAGYQWQYDADLGERGNVNMEVAAAQHGLGWNSVTPLHIGINLTVEWWKSLDKSPH